MKRNGNGRNWRSQATSPAAVCDFASVGIGWILSGGLRRKRPQGNSVTVIPAIIFTMQPPLQSPPPIIGIEVDQTWNGDDETMDEP